MYIYNFNQFIVESKNLPLLDYLKSNLKEEDFYFTDEKLKIEIKPQNHKTAIKVINNLKFKSCLQGFLQGIYCSRAR